MATAVIAAGAAYVLYLSTKPKRKKIPERSIADMDPVEEDKATQYRDRNGRRTLAQRRPEGKRGLMGTYQGNAEDGIYGYKDSPARPPLDAPIRADQLADLAATGDLSSAVAKARDIQLLDAAKTSQLPDPASRAPPNRTRETIGWLRPGRGDRMPGPVYYTNKMRF